MYQNLHMHTWRCKHAGGTEREYVERAIEGGFTDIGFSDHSPLPESFAGPVDGISRVRMDMGQLEDYVRTVKALRDEYAQRINIRTGLELEYIPSLHRELVPMLRDAGIEYFILGQHFLGHGEHFTNHETDDPDLLKRYCDTVLEGAATGDFCILAHPDVINFTGDDEIYAREMERMCTGLRETGIPLEINFYGMLKQRNYPDKRFWEIAGRTGSLTVFDADAHRPEQVWDPVMLEKGRELVKRYGLNYTGKVLD